MASVGEKLRAARLDQGLELTDLSATTKIGPKFLAAIEADDRKTIPGGFFYRSWAQQYACALSLDSAPIIAEIDQILLDEQLSLPPVQPAGSLRKLKPARITIERSSAGGSPLTYSFVLLVAVVLGCSGLYAWWHKTVETEDARVPVIAKQPVTPASPPAVFRAARPAVVRAAAPAVVAEVSQPAAKAPDGDVQIELSATEQTWVSISGDGKQAFSGILKPAEIRTVAARDVARIRVGNAGGLQVRLNGKPIGPIGLAGQVRTVIINKTGFQILENKPSTPAPIVQS